MEQTRASSCLYCQLPLQRYQHLVNLIDVTLVCEDVNSKLVDVVTVADVAEEDQVSNSVLQNF